MDVHELLGAVAADAPAPTPSTVLADLDRGRSALTRRRRRRATAGAALGVACVMGLTGLVQTHRDGDRTIGPASPAVSLEPTEPTASPLPPPADPGYPAADPFVYYRGPQSDAIHVDTIPQGWTSAGFDGIELRLVPPGTRADPDAGIRIVLADPVAEFSEDVVVLANGRPATLVYLGAGDHELRIDYPDAQLIVYLPPTDGPGWTEQEMLDFAAGIEVR